MFVSADLTIRRLENKNMWGIIENGGCLIFFEKRRFTEDLWRRRKIKVESG